MLLAPVHLRVKETFDTHACRQAPRRSREISLADFLTGHFGSIDPAPTSSRPDPIWGLTGLGPDRRHSSTVAASRRTDVHAREGEKEEDRRPSTTQDIRPLQSA